MKDVFRVFSDPYMFLSIAIPSTRVNIYENKSVRTYFCGFNYTERVSIRQRIKQSIISIFFQNIVRTEIMMKDSWKPSEYFHLQ